MQSAGLEPRCYIAELSTALLGVLSSHIQSIIKDSGKLTHAQTKLVDSSLDMVPPESPSDQDVTNFSETAIFRIVYTGTLMHALSCSCHTLNC